MANKYYHLGKDLFISVKPYRLELPAGLHPDKLINWSDDETTIVYSAAKQIFDPELIFDFDGKERTTYHVKFTDIEVKTLINVFKHLRLPWYKRFINFFKNMEW